MNIWIIDSSRGINLGYYSSFDLPINESLVSGLVSALNQLTMQEFKQPIESINMGGFKWIYIVDLKADLMFIMADSIDIDIETIKGRLNFIKQKFMLQFVPNVDDWKKSWTGDVERFKAFEEVIENYSNQWTQAESFDSLARFYDVMGIYQQLLNLARNIIENNFSGEEKEKIHENIEEIFRNFKSESILKKEPELEKIIFSRDTGFNLFNLNVQSCDVKFVRYQILNLIKIIIIMLKKELGNEKAMNLFYKEDITQYLISNLKLLKKNNLDTILLNLFLMD